MVGLSPLQLRVRLGLEDGRLLEILEDLEGIGGSSARGLSPGELALEALVLGRLEVLTAENFKVGLPLDVDRDRGGIFDDFGGHPEKGGV